MSSIESLKKYTGFYIDLSDSDNSRYSTPPPPTASDVRTKESTNLDSNEKKNIFSMFIDFDENKKPGKICMSQIPNNQYKRNEIPFDKNEIHSNSLILNSTTRRFHTTIPSEIKYVDASNSLPNNTMGIKRRSWNPQSIEKSSQEPQHLSSENERKCTSLSTDKNIMCILDKIPLIRKTSSMSIDTPNSPFEDFTLKSELSTCSNDSMSTLNSVQSSINNFVNEDSNEQKTFQNNKKIITLNETYDKSSECSLIDDDSLIISTATTVSRNTIEADEKTFQNELEITQKPTNVTDTIIDLKQKYICSEQKVGSSEHHTMETLQAKIEKQKLILESINGDSEKIDKRFQIIRAENRQNFESESNFVKLSDLDKPNVTKFDFLGDTWTKSDGTHRIEKLLMDSKIISNRNSWSYVTRRTTGNNLTNLASSVENLRSLSRLFPHLSRDCSNSLPSGIDVHNISPEFVEYVQSDVSCTSSLGSSFSRSLIDSAEESSLSCRQPRRLGEDLLKMFLQEIATDIVIDVNGRRMRAHKCILRSRCQYFAAILAGNWVQNAGNVISLTGYSYGTVHFALCHIYSGASHPPDGVSLLELAALADLLGLEGLKEVTSHALKTNYCHNFHKPCSGCIDGILQVFPITLNHSLDDLYRKCLRWVCKYYVKVWPTRAFTQIPSDIVHRCKQHIVAHLTSENVLNVILDCDNLLSLLARCGWSSSIENVVRDIIDAAQKYIYDHFASLLVSDGFLSLGHDNSWDISRLENLLLRISSTLTPYQACKSYKRVARLNSVLAARIIKMQTVTGEISNQKFAVGEVFHRESIQEEEMDWHPDFIRLVSSILSTIEQCLTRQCARAMRTNQWQYLDLELRTKIQKLASLSDTNAILSSKTNKKLVTMKSTSSQSTRDQDLQQVRFAIQAHSKRLLGQDTQIYRASTHTQTGSTKRITQTIDKGCQANHEIKPTEKTTNNVVKCSSRSQISNLLPSSSGIKNEPTKSFSHRRTQSETIYTTFKEQSSASIDTRNVFQKPFRFSDVRSRYLELKKPSCGKNQKQSYLPTANIVRQSIEHQNHQLNQRNMSSNRSSSSVALNKSSSSLITKDKALLIKTNKNNNNINKNTILSDNIMISDDSLCNSSRNSIKVDGTLTQESIKKVNNVSEPITKVSVLNSSNSRSNQVTNRNNSAKDGPSKSSLSTTNNNKVTITKHRTTDNIKTITPATKVSSSSLSSCSSIRSPRDNIIKNRNATGEIVSTKKGEFKSVSTSNIPVMKKSFLSAKSREILARRNALNQSSSTKNVPGFIKDKNDINVSQSISKSRSTSNVLNRTSMAFPNSLHVKRNETNYVTKLPTQKMSRNTICSNAKINQNNIDNHNVNDAQQTGVPLNPESKLERSSTFCKEFSDIPISKLEIVD